MPDALWPEFLRQHEARWDAEIAADEAATRRRDIREAIASLHRAEDCPRLGYVRDQCLALAAAALRCAGLPEYALRIEADDSVQRIINELAVIERGMP